MCKKKTSTPKRGCPRLSAQAPSTRRQRKQVSVTELEAARKRFDECRNIDLDTDTSLDIKEKEKSTYDDAQPDGDNLLELDSMNLANT